MRLRPILLLSALLCCTENQTADLVLTNGTIVTADDAFTIVEAVAIRDDRFVAVGSDGDVLAWRGANTEHIDLDGRTALPGLADNHYHAIGGGPGVDLASARTIAEVLDAIQVRAQNTPPGNVIITNSNWHEGQLQEQRLPLRDELDHAAPRHPVVVVRGGHEYIINTAAISHWEIPEDVANIAGGRIGRYADGRLNGELVDRAKQLVSLPAPEAPNSSMVMERLASEHQQLLQTGLTSIRHPGGSIEQYRMLQSMRDAGKLRVRINFLFRLGASTQPEQLDSIFQEWDVEPDEGDEWLRVGGIKLGVDGGFEGGWMREPYEEPWGENGTFYGLQTFPTDAYVTLVRALNERGWRVATHAVGDAAIDLVLDAYESAHADRPITDKRWVIEHGFIPRSDQIARVREMDVLVSAQHHLYLAAPSLVSYWGRDRAEWTTPVKTYIDGEIHTSLGTDSPVVPYNPFWTLYHFITRSTISAGVMGADQRISREQAIRASTYENAYLSFEESEKGSIAVGQLADLIVLSGDIMTMPEGEIEALRVELTMNGGQIVHTW